MADLTVMQYVDGLLKEVVQDSHGGLASITTVQISPDTILFQQLFQVSLVFRGAFQVLQSVVFD